jgi:hypothetical protein
MNGTGTTITFGTSSYAAVLLDVKINDISVKEIDISNMGSTDYEEMEFGLLKALPSLDLEVIFDPDDIPVLGVSETVTLTFPVPSGGSTGATYAGTAAVTAFEVGIPLEDKITANITVKFDGQTAPVWAVST